MRSPEDIPTFSLSAKQTLVLLEITPGINFRIPTAKIFRPTLVGAVHKKEAIMNELKCYSAYRDSQV